MTDFVPLTTARCRLGESPVWVPSLGQLWWLDIHRDTIHRYHWQSRESEAAQAVRPQHLRRSLRGRFGHRRAAEGPVSRTGAGRAGFAGDTGGDRHPGHQHQRREDGTGRTTVFRHARPDAAAVRWAVCTGSTTTWSPAGWSTGVTAGNGLDWSPDASVLYFVDSGDYRVWAFDFDSSDGSVSRQRVFASVAEPDGLPDGLTVDAAGGRLGGPVRRGTPAPVRTGRPAHRRLSRRRCATRPPAPSPVPAWTPWW